MKRAYAALILIPLVLGLSLGYELGSYMTEERIKVGPYEGQGIRVQVEIYRNGELVYVDYDDPAVDNFLLFLAGVIDNDVAGILVKDRGGLNRNPISYYGAAVVGISDDTTSSFNQTLIELPGTNVLLSAVDPTQIAVDTANKTITISGTITIPSSFTSFTVGWVGLYLDYSTDNGLVDGDEVLIFADPLGANAFTANPGDVITVVYKITVP